MKQACHPIPEGLRVGRYKAEFTFFWTGTEVTLDETALPSVAECLQPRNVETEIVKYGWAGHEFNLAGAFLFGMIFVCLLHWVRASEMPGPTRPTNFESDDE